MSTARKLFSPAAVILTAAGFATPASAQQCATSYEAGPPPGTRTGHAMAYDSARGVTVLFGGELWDPIGGRTVYRPDTWEWDGTGWTLRAQSGPPAQSGHTLAFDSSRSRTVFFGRSLDGLTSETWEWDGTAWALRAVGGPAPRPAAAIAYDSFRHVAVLFGGGAYNSSYFDDTWEWDGTSWTQRLVTGPTARRGHTMTFDSLRGVTVLFGGGCSTPTWPPLCGDTWEWDGVAWSMRSSGGPSPRVGGRMAYDAARQASVLFGGTYGPYDLWEWDGAAWTLRDANGPRLQFSTTVYDQLRGVLVGVGPSESGYYGISRVETWEWDGTNWINRSEGCLDWSPMPAHVPPSRQSSAMAYDSSRGVTVLFGGRASWDISDTWEWDGTSWTQRLGTAPYPRDLHAMAYDSQRAVIVVFGGDYSDLGGLSDTWEYDGANWTWRTNSGPSPRATHGMAYDGTRGVTVLFGGDPAARDTWEWDGTTWSLRATTGPTARSRPSLAFDSGRAVTVLFGGSADDPFPIAYSDTWEWDGATWAQRFPTGPVPPWAGPMAYDSVRAVSVLLSGDETWEWDGQAWELRATSGPTTYDSLGQATFDSSRGVTVVYGKGVGQTDVWEWNGSQWSLRSFGPPVREGHALAFDETRDVAVMFGGQAYPSFLGDTWEWNEGGWTYRTNSGPSPRAQHGTAYDSRRQVTVLFGGYSGTYPNTMYHNDTWEWDGMAWVLAATDGPPPVVDFAMAYDEQHQVVVLFGGSQYSSGSGFSVKGDTWEWDGVSWTLRATNGPEPRALHAMAYDSLRGVTVLFGGVNYLDWNGYCYTSLDDTWEWDGATWTLRCTGGPIARCSHAMTFDQERGVVVLSGGEEGAICDGGSFYADTWEWNGSTWRRGQAVGPNVRGAHSMVYDPLRSRVLVREGYGEVEMWEYGCRCAESAPGPLAEMYYDCPGPSACYATKNRFLSFEAPAASCGSDVLALRVTLSAMPGPADCPKVADFSAFNGVQMWVGPEVMQGTTATGVHRLQATPHFDTWDAMVHVSDCNIVPCASYTIEAIADVDYPAGPYSPPLVLATTPTWGDVVGNGGTPADGLVSAIDVVGMVNRFKSLPGSPPGTWCDVYANQPIQGVNLNIDALDITLIVDAFKGGSYPFPGPAAPNACP